MSVFFNGQLLVSPVTASQVNDDAMLNANLTNGNVVALVGKSTGGQPQTALPFGSPDEAAAVLNSGELLDAVKMAFDPSSDTNGPSTVIAIRINPAIQATGTLLDATSAPAISMTSIGYGQRENQIKIKVEAGSLVGRRITTQRGTDLYTQDNIGRAAFSVRYTGAAANATITINATTVSLIAPVGTTVATIDLTQFPDVQSLVDRISTVPGFTASVLESSYSKPALNGLDFVTAADVKTAALTVRADLQACIDWLNGSSQGYVSAARAAGAGAMPALSPFVYLTGGSDGTSTMNDWALAYSVLQTLDVQWVTPISSDPAVHAMNDAHCVFMSNVGRKERRGIVGPAIGTTDVAALALAKSLNSDRTSMVHLGHYDYDQNGLLTLYPPYMSAARLAGGFSGVSPGTPLTNKNFKCRGLERNLRNPTDTDVLILGGLLCLENTPTGYKVVQSISTWLQSQNYNRREVSCGAALDFAVRDVREGLDVLRGQKNNPLLLQRAGSIAQSRLAALAVDESAGGPGILAGNAANPAFRNITVSLAGDVIQVQFECSPVIPANYILVTVFAVPFSGTAVLAAAA